MFMYVVFGEYLDFICSPGWILVYHLHYSKRRISKHIYKTSVEFLYKIKCFQLNEFLNVNCVFKSISALNRALNHWKVIVYFAHDKVKFP